MVATSINKRLSTHSRRINDTVNNGRAYKMPSCICSCQLCIKSEVCFSDCWRLQRVAGETHNMTENALSILIVIFSVQLQQTEISDRKLFIFQHSPMLNSALNGDWSNSVPGENFLQEQREKIFSMWRKLPVQVMESGKT